MWFPPVVNLYVQLLRSVYVEKDRWGLVVKLKVLSHPFMMMDNRCKCFRGLLSHVVCIAVAL